MQDNPYLEHAEAMTPLQIAVLLQAHELQTADLRLIKNVVMELLAKIGFMNADGTVREHLDMKAIMSVVTKATMQTKKFGEEMAFLSDALPLIEKYKNL